MLRRPWAAVLAAFLIAMAVGLAPTHGHAQGAVQQLGPVVNGHLSMWVGNAKLMDAGGSPGAGMAPVNPTGSGILPTGLGLMNSGLGYCQFSGPASAPYLSFCWGFSNGGGLITLSSVGGGSVNGLSISINGSVYPFPGPGGGDVNGPASPPTVVGDLVTWNNTGGTLIADSGVSFLNSTMAWTATRLNPSGVPANLQLTTFVQGDGTTAVHGGMGIYSLAKDQAGTNAGNKGVGYAGDFNVWPLTPRGSTTPGDDMVALVASNVGIQNATSGLFVGGTAHSVSSSGTDFIADIELAGWATYGIIPEGHFIYGIDFSQGVINGVASYNAPIRLNNSGEIVARNFENTADLNVLQLDTNDLIDVGDLLVESTGVGGVRINGTGSPQDVAIAIAGVYPDFGIDLHGSTIASHGAMRIPNNTGIYGENAADNAALQMIAIESDNTVRLGAAGSFGIDSITGDAGETGNLFVSGTTSSLAYSVGSGGTPGTSCSGAPDSSFAVLNGIVTAC